MKQKKLVILSFSILLVVAVILGCGTPGTNFLIPVGGGAEFAFVVNSHVDSDVTGLTISAFTLDTSTGKLTPVPNSPFQTTATDAGGTLFIDADPSGHFLYVPNRGADTVSIFSIGSNGALSPAGAAVPTGASDAFSVRVHPNGKYLYVANRGNDTISAFSITASGGLQAIGTPLGVPDGSPRHLFVDPQGRFLYASVWGEGYYVGRFKINADGSLSVIGAGTSVAAGKEPQSGTVDSTGKFVLVANRGAGTVSVYSIDQSTGDLSQVTAQGSPFASGSGAFGVVEFSSGGTTYMGVVNHSAGSISVFTFDSATGKLTMVGAPVGDLNLSSPHWIAIDPSGKFGYIANQNDDNIVGVTSDASGNITTIPGSPFSGGGVSEPSQIILVTQQ